MNIARFPDTPKATDVDPKRTMSVGELIDALQKFDPRMPVGAGNAWIVGIEVGHPGFADLDRVEEPFVELIRFL